MRAVYTGCAGNAGEPGGNRGVAGEMPGERFAGEASESIREEMFYLIRPALAALDG
jgi:hypothetical protein